MGNAAADTPLDLLSVCNGPSYLLEVLLQLGQRGVNDGQIRLLPVVGHWAQSEVTETVPEDDAVSLARLIARLAPSGSVMESPMVAKGDDADAPDMRPRFNVNVRRDVRDDRVVGRLASFFDPLLSGLPAALPGEEETTDANPYEAAARNAALANRDDLQPGETWLDRLVWQMCVQYPELVETVAPDVQSALQFALGKIAEAVGKFARGEEAVGETAQTIARLIPRGTNLSEWNHLLQTAADRMAASGLSDEADRVRDWAEPLTVSDTLLRARRVEKLLRETSAFDLPGLSSVFPALLRQIEKSSLVVRIRVVRELMEIMATNALFAAAAVDMQFGMAYGQEAVLPLPMPPSTAAGRRPAPVPRIEQMSLTGGLDVRTILAHLANDWTDADGFLGVSGANTIPNEYQEIAALFSRAERRELCALLAWRRDAPTPFVLFAQAARLFIHPDVSVRQTRYAPAPSRMNTLLAQPGGTAVLGGRGRLLYPGLDVRIPIVKDGEAGGQRAGTRLRVLVRLFVPVSFRLTVVWQAESARLDRPTYLRHPFQNRLFLTTPWDAARHGDDVSSASDPAAL